jgi:hypothetical protein
MGGGTVARLSPAGGRTINEGNLGPSKTPPEDLVVILATEGGVEFAMCAGFEEPTELGPPIVRR